MSKSLAGFNRFLTLLIGLLLIALGAWPIAQHFAVPQVQKFSHWANTWIMKDTAQQTWYPWALLGLALLGILLGLWLIGANIRSRRFNRVSNNAASSPEGSIQLELASLAEGAANELETVRRVDDVKYKVFTDRNRPTMQFTINADPRVNLANLNAKTEEIEHDIRESIEELDLDTSYRIHLNRVPPVNG